METYNVELTGDEVKRRLHRDVIFKSEAAWTSDTNIYPEGSLLVYIATDNSQPRIKLADGKKAAENLPFVGTGGQSYWKNLDEETVDESEIQNAFLDENNNMLVDEKDNYLTSEI